MRRIFLFLTILLLANISAVFAGGGNDIAVPVDAKSEFIITIPPSDGIQLSNGGVIKIMRYLELPPEARTRTENMKFVAFDILIDNSDGDRNITNNSLYPSFNLRDINGFEYKASYMTYNIVKPAFPSTTIEKGEILRGWISFEILLSLTLNDLRLRFTSGNQFLEQTMVSSPWLTFSGF